MHVANNTGVFSVVCAQTIAMQSALGTFTRAWLHNTKKVEEVVQTGVFCKSVPRPLLGNSQRANGLAG
jgi:hypothetical protein